jgi:GNAT superfamily N-acetyltransferase
MRAGQNFVLRPAAPADVPEILRLIRGLAAYERLLDDLTITEDELRLALFGPLPHIHVILAEIEESPIGLALFYYTFSTFKARRNIFLEDLFVEPEHRGSGIGLALMRHLAQRALAENCRRLEWRVLNWNQPAIDFYRRIGAKPIDAWHTQQLGGDALVALARGISDG